MDWRSQFEMFMPHGMCLLWRPELMALHIISDGLIAIAYFVIPFAIWQFVRGRDDLQQKHRALAGLFSAFIAFCGLTHLVSILVLWIPVYIIEGWLKAFTAAVSMATAGMLLALVPRLLGLPSVQTLQREVEAHRLTLLELTEARAALALKVDRTEGQLRSSERLQQQSSTLLATVIEAVPGLIYAKDRAGRMLMSNRATLGLIGKEWPDVKGRTDREFLPDQRQAELIMANDRRVFETGTVQELEEVIDYPGRGPRIWLSTKVPFCGDTETDAGATGLVGVSIDITDRKRLEKEMVNISRRSAMGELGTAIAHEINQPLNAVSIYIGGCVELLEKMNLSGPVIPSLKLANEQCLRAGEIIRRLRSFVAGEDAAKRPVQIRRLIDEACAIGLLGAREQGVVTSVKDLAPDLYVTADQVQIEQVIVNLVRNALDAMSGAAAGMLEITVSADDETAMVTVADNGPGIRQDVLNHLFEPFVSTKGVTGLGVGLSISRTIIENHGGKIWATAVDSGGAMFSFTLPVAGGPSDGIADADGPT